MDRACRTHDPPNLFLPVSSDRRGESRLQPLLILGINTTAWSHTEAPSAPAFRLRHTSLAALSTWQAAECPHYNLKTGTRGTTKRREHRGVLDECGGSVATSGEKEHELHVSSVNSIGYSW